MKHFHYLFHTVLYYSSWIVGILLAARGYAWFASTIIALFTGIQLVWQIKLRKHINGMFLFVLILTLLGTLTDSLLVRYGIVIFNANPFSPYFSPPWMMAIWISFAVSMFSLFSTLFHRYISLSILSFFGFSLAYAAGVKLSAAQFPFGYVTSLFIGLIWSLLLPTSIAFYQWVLKCRHQN